MEKLNLTQ